MLHRGKEENQRKTKEKKEEKEKLSREFRSLVCHSCRLPRLTLSEVEEVGLCGTGRESVSRRVGRPHRRRGSRALAIASSSVSTQPRCCSARRRRPLTRHRVLRSLESRDSAAAEHALEVHCPTVPPRTGSIARKLELWVRCTCPGKIGGSSRFRFVLRAEISSTNDSTDQPILCDILSNIFTR